MVNIKKNLYRLPSQGKVFGVCAGLADYLDMDVTLMRVIFVILTFITGGAMVLLYVVLAVVLPVPGEIDDTVSEKVERLGKDLHKNKIALRTRNYFGFGLIVFGVWLLIGQFVPEILNIRWDFVWPALLILVGFLIIVRRGYDN